VILSMPWRGFGIRGLVDVIELGIEIFYRRISIHVECVASYTPNGDGFVGILILETTGSKRMKKQILPTFLIAIVLASTVPTITQAGRNQMTGPYLGQTPPGTTPELFAPGILSTSLHDDGPAIFNLEGTQVFFRKWAVPHDIVGTMSIQNGYWTRPSLFKPMGKYVTSVPIFLADGKKAFFISRRPLSGEGEPADYNVWVADRMDEGFGELVPLGPNVNTPEHEYLYSVSASGTLYFQGTREDSLGGYDFYKSELVDGVYQTAVHMEAPLNTEYTEAAPNVSQDESYLVYCMSGAPDSFGGLDLYVSFKQRDGSWGAGVNLGSEVNTPSDEKFPALTMDGQYLFFVGHQGDERSYTYSDMTYEEAIKRNQGPGNGEGDVYWVSIDVIERLRPRQ
jgi:hypothetical protein